MPQHMGMNVCKDRSPRALVDDCLTPPFLSFSSSFPSVIQHFFNQVFTMPPALPNEILKLIILNLDRKRPADVAPKKGNIHQRDLATMMRVSKVGASGTRPTLRSQPSALNAHHSQAVHSLVAPILYRHVHFTDIKRFVIGLAVPGEPARVSTLESPTEPIASAPASSQSQGPYTKLQLVHLVQCVTICRWGTSPIPEDCFMGRSISPFELWHMMRWETVAKKGLKNWDGTEPTLSFCQAAHSLSTSV